jgi:tagaturonate reductase
MTKKILQFGEGNFLRAFVDWHFQQLNNSGANFEVHIAQPQPQGMVDLLTKQNCEYTVVLEGLLNGNKIETKEKISVVKSAFNPYTNPQAALDLAVDPELEFIVSNTTEAGIAYDETDVPQRGECPKSFPGKVAKLLHTRFEEGLPGLKFLPCELIEANGDNLLRTVLLTVDNWWSNELNVVDFKNWINEENIFYNTLVDRIVPGYPRDTADEIRTEIGWEDQLIVKAEPFGLFVIEHKDAGAREYIQKLIAGTQAAVDSGKVLDVIVTDKLQPYRERKVKLLNGPHTAMTPLGLLNGVETVREMLEHPQYGPWIDSLMRDEIASTIDLPADELSDFVDAVKERFLNPYVKHNLTSIALNSVSKWRTRLLPSYLSYQKTNASEPTKIREAFDALVKFYQSADLIANGSVQDDDDVIEKMQTTQGVGELFPEIA